MKGFITWLKSAGLRSVFYLIGAFAAKALFGSNFLFGLGWGVFLADNWVTIKQIWKDKVEPILEDISNGTEVEEEN